jgi:hypothetical protein
MVMRMSVKYSLNESLIAVSILIIAALACGTLSSGGSNPTNTQPPVQVFTGQPTPSNPEATQVQTSGSAQYFTEDFNTNDLSSYTQFLTSGNASEITVSIQDGYMIFNLPTKNQWVYEYYTPQTYTDTRIDIIADNRSANDNNISLFCRYDETGGWYEFNIANSGLYQILYGKWDNDKIHASYAIVADGGSTKIKQGKAVNKYSAVCNSQTLTLYINDSKVRTVDDKRTTLNKGYAGFGVSSFNLLPVNVAIDSLTISQP